MNNCEEDYSYATECIGFLKSATWLSANRGIEGFFSKAKRNMFSRCEIVNNLATKYFECPEGIIVAHRNQDKVILDQTEIPNIFYNKLNNAKLNFGDISEINNTILSEISSMYYSDINKNLCQIQAPCILKTKFTKREGLKTIDFINSLKNNDVYFHIRIKFNENSIYNLQYLALLLNHHGDLVANGKLSVVLLSDSMPLSYYPFCNPNNPLEIKQINDIHDNLSQYLRLLSKDNSGVIFAPRYDGFTPTIAPMDFKKASIGSRFFPLMIINDSAYNKLFVTHDDTSSDNSLSARITKENLWDEDNSKANKYILFQTDKYRYYNANSENPHLAFLAYIAETAWKRLQNSIEEYDDEQKLIFKKEVLEKFTKQQNNWLTFAIFSFLYTSNSDEVKETEANLIRIDHAYKAAVGMSKGLQQLMQNSIQHSKYQSCVFTFYIDNDNKLKLFVVDMNTNSSLTDNFKQRLKNEIRIYSENNTTKNQRIIDSYDKLINYEDIKLSHFFNTFNDTPFDNCTKAKEVWRAFRSSDCTAHIGLLLFYQAAAYCHADFTVQSNINYELECSDNRFSITNSKSNNTITAIDETSLRIMPGTQYLITISLNDWTGEVLSGGASISRNTCLEDYSSFADVIEFESVSLPCNEANDIISSNDELAITDPNQKFTLQNKWENILTGYISNLQSKNKRLYYWHISDDIFRYFQNSGCCEVFIKGLFGALSNCSEDIPIYLAITNLPDLFLETFREVLISFSCKSFSKNIQLYFIDSDNQLFAHIIGHSILQAVINSVELSIEHGSALFHPEDSINAVHIASIIDQNTDYEALKVIPFDVIVPVDNQSNMSIFEARMLKTVEQKLDGADSHGYKLVDTHTRLGSKVHIQSFYEMSFLFYRTTIANRIAFKILKQYSGKLKKLIDFNNLTIEPIMYYSYSSYSKAIITSLVEITQLYLESIVRYYNNIKDTTLPTAREDLELKLLHMKSQVAFASYQYNLQSETNANAIQLYFGLPKDYDGALLSHSNDNLKKLDLLKDIHLIMIVPISSTLTTFDKMLEKLYSYLCDSTDHSFILSDNYTAFWVGDCKCKTSNTYTFPSNIEKEFWIKADNSSCCITVCTDGQKGLRLLNSNPHIHYFMRVTTSWNLPLKCELCFPDEYSLINEVPLVETDLTSTVPAQQIRAQQHPLSALLRKEVIKKNKEMHIGFAGSKTTGNNSRIMMLKDCVYYGHIERGKNHHQYYISTQDYFYKDEVKDEIREWLVCLKEKHQLARSKCSSKLKIIFSPEHNTNVGFAQYVNTYYFGGSAEIISINEDKEYRTNFICEHEVIRRTIERLHVQNDIFDANNPVEFYFVDDSVNTGYTIKKANSFLRSLIPEKYISLYPANIIKKCFILIDRLSDASKGTLVLSGDPSDYHAFVHIDISHMRRQGDSCVGCKLQNEAARLFGRSPLRITTNYWAKKYMDLIPVRFDDINKMSLLQNKKHAYERLVLSHVAQNFIFKDGINTRERGEYYDSIIYLIETIINFSKKNHRSADDNFYFYDLISDMINNLSEKSQATSESGIERWNTITRINYAQLIVCELLIKLLARPFFSFDFSFRIQIQTFLIILSECYLGIKDDNNVTHHINGKNTNDEIETITKVLTQSINNTMDYYDENLYKDFMLKNNRIKKTVVIASNIIRLIPEDERHLLCFFKDVLFEALTDMKSTYLLRKRVIERLADFVSHRFNTPCDCSCSSVCDYLIDKQQCYAPKTADCFWITYLAHVHKLLDSNTDEIRALWFYYYMLTGNEIAKNTSLDCSTDISKLSSYSDIEADLFLLTASLERDTMEKWTCPSNTNLAAVTSTKPYHLSNLFMQRKWAGMSLEKNIDGENWIRFLKDRHHKNDENNARNPISQRYSIFTTSLLKMLIEGFSDKSVDFHVAVISSEYADNHMNSKKNTMKIDDIHILSEDSSIKNRNWDVRQERYIIKDRILNAWNNQSDRRLANKGYFIEKYSDFTQQSDEHSPQYDMSHHISNNYHKPYIIVSFDNPSISNSQNDTSIGRKLSKIGKVFLYIGIISDSTHYIKQLSLFVLRQVLSCRDLIMQMLEEDFESEIMQKHAKSIQEEIVITHERSSSHASTTDERGVLQVFGLGDVSPFQCIKHPIQFENKKLIEDAHLHAELWLLFQNYVNSQIARLFNRVFCLNSNTAQNSDVPKLYLTDDNVIEYDEFKKPVKCFHDLMLDSDERFNMLKKIIHFDININNNEKLHSVYLDEQECNYNCEFMRCILFDIFFSAIKYATTDQTILARINNLIRYYHSNECVNNEENYVSYTGKDGNIYKHKLNGSAGVHSYVFMFKRHRDLIILNNVNTYRIDISKCSQTNEEIYRRTHDALDYGDGHMSLFTIRQFVLGINNLNNCDDITQDNHKADTEFKYIDSKEALDLIKQHSSPNIYTAKEIQTPKIWFMTKLPIFAKEENCSEISNMD